MKTAKAITIIVFLELSIAILAVVADDLTIEALHTTTRFSGRLSLILFSAIFLLIGSKAKLNAILSSKYFLVFAIAHGIHLGELLSYLYFSGHALNPVRVLGGFIAYLIIFIMPVVHYLYESGKVSEKKFRIFQTSYLSYVLFIFFMTYLPRVMGTLPNVGGNYWEFVVLFIWVIMLPTIKVIELKRFKPAPKS